MSATSRRQGFRALVEPLETRQLFSVVVGLNANNVLITFDDTRPNVVLDRQKVTGLDPRDRLVGIDYRPSDGLLYGVGRNEALYSINPITGVATKIGVGLDTPISNTAAYGVDFDPVADLLRVVNTDDENLRIDPATGAIVDSDGGTPGTQLDSPLAYEGADISAGINPQVAAAAYNNSFAGATTTTLYALDSATGNLVTIGGVDGTPSPDGGLLNTVGSLGVNFTTVTGMDIATSGGVETAYAVLRVAGRPGSRLYSIDLSTGAGTFIRRTGGGGLIDIAVMPPGPTMTALQGRRLLTFDAQRPDVILSRVRVTGLVRGDRLLAMDYRPSTGELFAIGRRNLVYNINPDTGFATAVGDGLDVGLNDDEVGFDFDPVLDQIRVVTEDNQNFRIDPLTGEIVDADPVTLGVQLDTPLTFSATPNVDMSSVAYSQNVAGASNTTLFGLDFERGILVTQGSVNGTPTSPNTGQLFSVGPLNLTVDDDDSAFDIVTTGGVDRALAAIRPISNRVSHLFDIDLVTGAATLIGKIGKGTAPILGLSARP